MTVHSLQTKGTLFFDNSDLKTVSILTQEQRTVPSPSLPQFPLCLSPPIPHYKLSVRPSAAAAYSIWRVAYIPSSSAAAASVSFALANLRRLREGEGGVRNRPTCTVGPAYVATGFVQCTAIFTLLSKNDQARYLQPWTDYEVHALAHPNEGK